MYTDGACVGNPGPGGWAWAVPDGPFATGAEARTTNQRMEITAAIEALRALPGRVHVMSDSTYVVNCWRDRWWERWVANGWKNSKKQPVANSDLWQQLVPQFTQRRGEITFEWVKGHGDDPFNDLVDRLAVEAARTQEGRSGDAPPKDLGAADEAGQAGPGSAGSAPTAKAGGPEAQLPDGRRLLVTGHRPPELGGYDENPVAARVRSKLADIIGAKRELHPDLVVVTGLQLGAEQLGAEAAAAAGVPYVAVLGYPEQERRWPRPSQERFRRLLDGAAARIVLQRKAPESPQQAGAALQRRDAWLARHSHEAVAVWDGDDPAIGKLTRSLEDHLGDDVWVLDPAEA